MERRGEGEIVRESQRRRGTVVMERRGEGGAVRGRGMEEGQ